MVTDDTDIMRDDGDEILYTNGDLVNIQSDIDKLYDEKFREVLDSVKKLTSKYDLMKTEFMNNPSPRYQFGNLAMPLYDLGDNFIVVTDHGVIADGATDSIPFLDTIMTNLSSTGGVIYFPAADLPYLFMSEFIITKSNVKIFIEKGATIKAGAVLSTTTRGLFQILDDVELENVLITGGGLIDGNNLIIKAINFRGNQTHCGVDGVNFKDFDLTTMDFWGGNNGTEASATCTVSRSTDTFTSTAHGLQTDDEVYFISSDGCPVIMGKIYFVIRIDADTFQISESAGGSALNIFTDGQPNLRWRKWDFIQKNPFVRNCYLKDCAEGIIFIQCADGHVLNNCLDTMSLGGDGIEMTSCREMRVIGNRIMDVGAGNGCIDIFNDSFDLIVANNQITQTLTDRSGTAGITVGDNAFESYAKARVLISGNNIQGTLSSGISVSGIMESLCIMECDITVNNPSDSQGAGIALSSECSGRYFIINDNNITNCRIYGLNIQAGMELCVYSSGNLYGDNSNNGGGISINIGAAAPSGIHTFNNDTFIGTNSTPANGGQAYHIFDNGGNLAARFINCTFLDNVFRVHSHTSTNTACKFINCFGFNSNVRGTPASITALLTSVTVTHTLGDAVGTTKQKKIPTSIFITPITGLGTAVSYWVDTIDNTTFNINLNAAPGSTVTFAWNAIWE